MAEEILGVPTDHSPRTSSGHTNVPHGQTGPGNQPQEQPDGQPSLVTEVDVKRYLDLHRAAAVGNWDAARGIIDRDPNALTATITLRGMTALHVAARNGRSEFVEKLVERLTADELAKPEEDGGRNALHFIATYGTERALQKIVAKNPNLPQTMDKSGHTPMLIAVYLGLPQRRRAIVKFLVDQTKDKAPSFAFTGEFSMQLILGIVELRYYDIALDLIRKYPNLALAMDKDEGTILHVIAKDPSSFQSGRKLSFWKRLLYPRTSTNIQCSIELEQYNLLSIVESVCHAVLTLDNEQMQTYVNSLVATVTLATKNGVVELVKEILKYFPDSLWYVPDDRSLLYVAVEHRRENVFNYLVNLAGEITFEFGNSVGRESGDNIWHAAAKLAPFHRLHSDSYLTGSALLMQRELQWFKEVEKLVVDTQRRATNNAGKTPQQVFTEEHMKLREDGEKWMKDISSSCMVVATLVATIVFAAMITVPGGIRGDTGIPIYLRKNSFLVFIIANGLSAFSSLASILVFLSILTSRYAEEDFLKSLPVKLVGGLSFQLIAIVSMTTAFAAALQIAVTSKFRLSFISSIFLGCVPVILFLRLQLPLFWQVIKSTYGPSIFEQSDRKHWWTKLWHREKKEQMLV